VKNALALPEFAEQAAPKKPNTTATMVPRERRASKTTLRVLRMAGL
jgi:hypothetical protein